MGYASPGKHTQERGEVSTTSGKVDLKLRAQRSPGGTEDCPFAREPDEDRPAAAVHG